MSATTSSIAAPASTQSARTINMVVAALGGEGGGVLANWLIEIADSSNWIVQNTSLAGVAQRTGATIYYLEFFPRELAQDRPPVMSLFPAQGDIDIAVSSEIAEAGRMLQRGFITPDRTTLISSTHRVYAIDEKTDLADGTINAEKIQHMAARYAHRFIHLDMQEVAKRNNAVISAALLGAIAASGALPFAKESYEQTIRKTGKAVDTNLAAFADSFASTLALANQGDKAIDSSVSHYQPDLDKPAATNTDSGESDFILPTATTEQGQKLLSRLAEKFPQATHRIIYHGLKKTIEYQDFDYGENYLDQIASIVEIDDPESDFELSNSCARYLALWMCFEDIPRVAQLKIRHERMQEIGEEVKAEDGQIFYVTEFFRPRPEEICAILPAKIGKTILASKLGVRFLNLFAGPKKLRTNTLSIYLSLRFLAMLRRFRRKSLGYQHEQGMIDEWLNAIRTSAVFDLGLAIELANCGRIVKGYGKTRERTTAQIMRITHAYGEQPNLSAEHIKALHQAALADDSNIEFDKALVTLSA